MAGERKKAIGANNLPIIKLYRKTIEINLIATAMVYPLDKFQSLNGKPLRRILVPNYFQPSGLLFNYLSINPKTQTGKLIVTGQEAIDGAYLSLTNQQNQLVDDGTSMAIFKTDDSYFSKKLEYEDTPYIDWTQSQIFYPDLTIPIAYAGKSWQMIVEYFDWVYEDQLHFSTS